VDVIAVTLLVSASELPVA